MNLSRYLRATLNPPLLGTLILALSTAFLAYGETELEQISRSVLFDSYQRWFPRSRVSDPVVVVEIDEQSLAQLGQWPWPRSRLAGLVDEIARAGAAVIAIDALFVEPDRYSPSALALQLGLDPAATASLAATLPNSDEVFARTLRATPTIVAVAGVAESVATPRHANRVTPILQRGGNAFEHLSPYPVLLRNLPLIDDAASAHGAINVEPDAGVVRRVPTLVASTAGDLVPSLAIETLRVAAGRDSVRASIGAAGIHDVEVADLDIPTLPNGEWWLHFSRWEERPAFSAASVLRGTVAADTLRGRIVLIGYTALGLLDTITSPLGRMPGVEVHAEAIENALEGRLLSRARWMARLELGFLIVLGTISIWGVSRWRPMYAAAAFMAGVVALVSFGVYAFLALGWLIDVANPAALGGLVFMSVLGANLGEAQSQRWLLRQELAAEREVHARLQGELDAARRIQLGMLPNPVILAGDRRVDVVGRMMPARTVGGDLYDFFRLDRQRLFFLIGDVSGKGLPSALFMALAKAQFRGAAERVGGDPGATLTEVNKALAQDNPEMLFLTAFAGLLDLDSGELRWSNAGHESPYLLPREDRLDHPFDAVGPPLCVIDDFAYESRCAWLAERAALCLMTDGITEARNAAYELFGAPRVLAALTTLAPDSDSETIVDSVTDAVTDFVGACEQADDITLLCVRRAEPNSPKTG
ncbi:MAG: CHASE2 domain-containing protein [Gammaproteobacteria bacterium]|nr:CHASE2 domain-containing protein [Gammaproteobacteria bacterium]